MGYVFGSVATFGENLQRLRKRAGFSTAKRLADALEMTQPQLSKIEKDLQGLPTGTTLLALAKAIRFSIDELLEGVDADYDAVLDAAASRHGPMSTGISLTAEQVELLERWALLKPGSRDALRHTLADLTDEALKAKHHEKQTA